MAAALRQHKSSTLCKLLDYASSALLDSLALTPRVSPAAAALPAGAARQPSQRLASVMALAARAPGYGLPALPAAARRGDASASRLPPRPQQAGPGAAARTALQPPIAPSAFAPRPSGSDEPEQRLRQAQAHQACGLRTQGRAPAQPPQQRQQARSPTTGRGGGRLRRRLPPQLEDLELPLGSDWREPDDVPAAAEPALAPRGPAAPAETAAAPFDGSGSAAGTTPSWRRQLGAGRGRRPAARPAPAPSPEVPWAAGRSCNGRPDTLRRQWESPAGAGAAPELPASAPWLAGRSYDRQPDRLQRQWKMPTGAAVASESPALAAAPVAAPAAAEQFADAAPPAPAFDSAAVVSAATAATASAATRLPQRRFSRTAARPQRLEWTPPPPPRAEQPSSPPLPRRAARSRSPRPKAHLRPTKPAHLRRRQREAVPPGGIAAELARRGINVDDYLYLDRPGDEQIDWLPYLLATLAPPKFVDPPAMQRCGIANMAMLRVTTAKGPAQQASSPGLESQCQALGGMRSSRLDGIEDNGHLSWRDPVDGHDGNGISIKGSCNSSPAQAPPAGGLHQPAGTADLSFLCKMLRFR